MRPALRFFKDPLPCKCILDDAAAASERSLPEAVCPLKVANSLLQEDVCITRLPPTVAGKPHQST